MHKLSHGHSIMFFAPLQINQHIHSVATKGPLDNIDTMDILHWAIREMYDEIQQQAPYWVQQGTDHRFQYAAWSHFCEGWLTPQVLSKKWLQPEAKHLEDLYGPHSTLKPPLLTTLAIHQRCRELVVLSVYNVNMDEEQEREMVHEARCEQQVEHPPRVPPVTHSIHQDVIAFVKTGIIPTNSCAFHPAFKSLDTASAANHKAHIWSPSVRVTTVFEKTIVSSKKIDSFLRPVQWIVSGKVTCIDPILVILSPHEANHLMLDIRMSDNEIGRALCRERVLMSV